MPSDTIARTRTGTVKKQVRQGVRTGRPLNDVERVPSCDACGVEIGGNGETGLCQDCRLHTKAPFQGPWALKAACALSPDAPPETIALVDEIFFPKRGGTATRARKICAGCPVQTECLEYSLSFGHIDGVWGGHTERERRDLRAKLGALEDQGIV